MRKLKWTGCAVCLMMMLIFVQTAGAENCTLQVTLNSAYPGIGFLKGATVTVTNLQGKTTEKELQAGITAIPLEGSCGKRIEGKVYFQGGIDSRTRSRKIIPLEARGTSGVCLPCQLQIERGSESNDFTFVVR